MFAQFSTIVETIEKKRLDKSMFDLNEETRELIQPYIDLIEMLYKQDTDAGISVGGIALHVVLSSRAFGTLSHLDRRVPEAAEQVQPRVQWF